MESMLRLPVVVLLALVQMVVVGGEELVVPMLVLVPMLGRRQELERGGWMCTVRLSAISRMCLAEVVFFFCTVPIY